MEMNMKMSYSSSRGVVGNEAMKYVWEGAIPLQIHLHDAEVTTLPPPPSALILAPRIGYLPLLVPQIKPFFSSALPPGEDTVWFEYEGLPLKWYIPTGVLFDILCPEPERPWNLTVHFRGYPVNLLTPCENEDCIKWSFINSLKEAAYVINGNCKNVMNMSQNDQVELWRSVVNGNLEAYIRVSNKLKLEIGGDEKFYSSKSPKTLVESDNVVPVKAGERSPDIASLLYSTIIKKLEYYYIRIGEKLSERRPMMQFCKNYSNYFPGRIPVRLYVINVVEDFDDLEGAPRVDSWDKISYINRPVEIHGEGNCFTLLDAVKMLLPEFFTPSPLINEAEAGDEQKSPSTSEEGTSLKSVEEVGETSLCDNAEIKLLRIQGIEPKFEIPFSWVVNNLMNPERFLHICVYIRIPETITI